MALNKHRRSAGNAEARAFLHIVSNPLLDLRAVEVARESVSIHSEFPSVLNERFDSFGHFIDAGDVAEPTKSQLEVFQTLSKQLDDQVAKWTQIKSQDVAKVSDLIKQANLPGLIITTPKTEAPKETKSS